MSSGDALAAARLSESDIVADITRAITNAERALCGPGVANQIGNRSHRLIEFHPLAVDHDRDEAIVALAVHRVGAQGIERLARLAGDVSMIGRILIAELVRVGGRDVASQYDDSPAVDVTP